MNTYDVENINRHLRFTYDRLHNGLIGREAAVIGRPELTGIVDAISLNPHGVVIVVLKTGPRRLRLPADTLHFGPRVTPLLRRRYQRISRPLPSPPAVAIVKGRLAL